MIQILFDILRSVNILTTKKKEKEMNPHDLADAFTDHHDFLMSLSLKFYSKNVISVIQPKAFFGHSDFSISVIIINM